MSAMRGFVRSLFAIAAVCFVVALLASIVAFDKMLVLFPPTERYTTLMERIPEHMFDGNVIRFTRPSGSECAFRIEAQNYDPFSLKVNGVTHESVRLSNTWYGVAVQIDGAIAEVYAPRWVSNVNGFCQDGLTVEIWNTVWQLMLTYLFLVCAVICALLSRIFWKK